MVNHKRQFRFRWRVSFLVAALTGCVANQPGGIDSPAKAWRQRDTPRADASTGSADQPKRPAETSTAPALAGGDSDDEVIATVDGRPITRRSFVNALMHSHGASLLDQRIGLETAKTLASREGVSVTEADVEREYDLALRRLSDPLAAVSPGPFDRSTAERLLDSVLAQRNMSRDEFEVIMRRNAHLRKVVRARQRFSEADLRGEYDRVYDRRVQVRHIQSATLREVEQVREALAAGGDFGEVARVRSANRGSSGDGGLLEAFSEADERLPLPFRRAAFSLETPGERSDAVRVGEWYHILQLERVIPARAADFAEVRDELEQSLGDRRAESELPELFEKLFREATIRVHDPVLEAAFNRRHPGRLR